jgi:hypothetical protein
MSAPGAPTPSDLRAAFEAGAPLRFGLPTVVPLAAGGVAHLDLAAAARGDPDPWHVVREVGPILDISTSGDRSVYAGGSVAPVWGADLGALDAALALGATAQAPRQRHRGGANGLRRAAGALALEIRDAHVRAAVLDAVDGWSAIREAGRLIDETSEGELLAPADEALACHVLIVRCPSTSRVYALRVPRASATVAEARKWVNRGREPEVET